MLHITKENFPEVVQSPLPVLIDFWASWCGPCRMLSPVIEELAEELEGKAVVGKINVDEEAELASQFGVMSIPTLIVMKNGSIFDSSIGVKSKNSILEMLKL